MSHIDIDKTVQLLVDTSAQLLQGHGYEIVTEDKKLFPYFLPSLAALKQGRLLVFSIAVFPGAGEFQREADSVQAELQDAVEGNTPDSDPRAHYVEKIAVVLAADSVEDLAPAGDIHWIGLGSPGELAEKLRRELAL